jgi:hypothetical protein
MTYKEFMGHCFCDTRFQQLREMILNGATEFVLDIQRMNEERKRNHRYQEICTLCNERLK